jgi:hypothetical protein
VSMLLGVLSDISLNSDDNISAALSRGHYTFREIGLVSGYSFPDTWSRNTLADRHLVLTKLKRSLAAIDIVITGIHFKAVVPSIAAQRYSIGIMILDQLRHFARPLRPGMLYDAHPRL